MVSGGMGASASRYRCSSEYVVWGHCIMSSVLSIVYACNYVHFIYILIYRCVQICIYEVYRIVVGRYFCTQLSFDTIG